MVLDTVLGVRDKESTTNAILQKIQEWVIATRLERNYTKEEIMAMYLNIYDFGYAADGIRSAARIYFGKEPSKLRPEESAVLVGMLKNSSLYNPIRREELVLNRRNTVLGQMAKYEYITQKEKDSLQALEMNINFSPESHREGLGTYFRMYLQRWLNNWIENNPKPDGTKYNIYLDGLKVFTEIRASFKEKTEMTVFDWNSDSYEKDTIMTPMDSIRYYKTYLRAAMMSMEPQTGHVKAWVGGVDFKHFQYDNVYQGSRQAGSTFKPFVYAAAIDQLRYSPCDSLPDTQYCIEPLKHGNPDAWCPKNSNGKYSLEKKTLKSALANSTNSITAPDINVFEMVGAYGTFANQGVYVKPVTITRIEDKNRTVLYEYVPETKDVLSQDVAYTMVNLMEGPMNLITQ